VKKFALFHREVYREGVMLLPLVEKKHINNKNHKLNLTRILFY